MAGDPQRAARPGSGSGAGTTAEAGPDPRQLARAVRAIAIASRLFEKAAQELGVSLPQYRLLLWVRSGPRRAADLAERIAVRRPTITALVSGLVDQGLLQRAPVAGDRRGISLELTAAGREALRRVEGQLGEALWQLSGSEQGPAVLAGLDLLAGALEHELERRGALPAEAAADTKT